MSRKATSSLYGINNNSIINTRNVPSNRYPINYSGNPNDNFTGLSSKNNLNQNSGSYVHDAFEPKYPVIEPIDYSNQNELLHNNVGSSVLHESIVEYTLNIDSLDRDISVYPNPFSFTLTFNNVPSVVKNKMYFQGSPSPILPFNFRNVKFIRLDSAVLPNWSEIVYNETDKKYEYSTEEALLNDRFTTLSIPQIDTSSRVLYTASYSNNRENVNLNDAFTDIYCDKMLNKYNFKGYSINNFKYRNIALGNINKLTFNLHNSCGELLKFNGLLTSKDLEEAKLRGCSICKTDIRHPLNKHNQVYYTLKVGVVEGDVNNETQLFK